jgi:hypothetical protein
LLEARLVTRGQHSHMVPIIIGDPTLEPPEVCVISPWFQAFAGFNSWRRYASGEQLLQGETDGSSYPNGGMRATHTAGGYLSLDPMSPIFLREDTVYIPAAFVSYNGEALDEKTPLHRATQAMDKEGTRLLKVGGPVQAESSRPLPYSSPELRTRVIVLCTSHFPTKLESAWFQPLNLTF